MLLNIPHRVILCVMIFVGLIANYMLRVNMNFAIVYMVSDGVNATNATNATGGDNLLDWSKADQEWIKSAFFYGYFALQVPGGRLAELFGTKKVFGISMVGASLLGAITPVVANLNVWAVFVLRILQGLCEAVTYPALNPMISKWVPHSEKSSFVAFAFVGGTFGSVITYPLCGEIIKSLGWEAVFYITAGISLAWCLVWFLVVSDLPEEHRYITQAEKHIILTGRTYDPSSQEKERSVPITPLLWDALSSPAMLAIMACDFANSWGLYMLLTEGPAFFNDVLKFDISENGWLSGLPYLGRFIGAQVFGFTTGLVMKKSLMSDINIQKVNVFIELIIPAAGMIWLSFTTDSPYLCVAIMSISFGFNGAIYNAHSLNTLTIAPNRAGIVMGMGNGFGAMAGFIVPAVKSAIVGETKNMEELLQSWRIVFGLPAIFSTFATVVFIIWGSGQVQKFNWRTYSKADDNVQVESKISNVS